MFPANDQFLKTSFIVSFTQAGRREVAKVRYLLAAEKRKFEVSMESNSVTQH